MTTPRKKPPAASPWLVALAVIDLVAIGLGLRAVLLTF